MKRLYVAPERRSHGDIRAITRGGETLGDKDQWWKFFSHEGVFSDGD